MTITYLVGYVMRDVKTVIEWQAELGRQIRDLRLRQNLDQLHLAEQAGVALNVVKRLEYGSEAKVSSFIKVLRALGRADWLNTLAPEVAISPLQMLKEKPVRQRASRPKGTRGE
jgi:transcriptional regulator with XRE-family HTH domain